MKSLGLLAVLCAAAAGCAEGAEATPTKVDTGGVDVPLLEATVDAPTDGGVDATDSTTDAGATDATAEAGADATLDSGVDSAGDSAIDAADTGTDAGAPYRRTITIDGVNDFSVSNEKLTTTSTAYDSYLTWDAAALYVGYAGPDLGTSASTTKWLFVYLDTDPGTSSGATKGEQYASQAPAFGAGFGAEAYFGYRTDGGFSHFKRYSAGSWSTLTTSGVTLKATGNYVEIRIPWSALGATPTKLGVATLMMNEAASGEWSYAGLYSGSYTDGYYGSPSTVPMKYWLQADLGAPTAPSAIANRKP